MIAPRENCQRGRLGLSYSWSWIFWSSRASSPFHPAPRTPASPDQLCPLPISLPSPAAAPSLDLCQYRSRSCESSCCRVPRGSRRFRCQNDGNLNGRCSLCGTWSTCCSCDTWKVAPAGSPGSTREACICACTNEFATEAPRRTTCRLRNRRFEWGIPAAWKTTFIGIFFIFFSFRPFSRSATFDLSEFVPWNSTASWLPVRSRLLPILVAEDQFGPRPCDPSESGHRWLPSRSWWRRPHRRCPRHRRRASLRPTRQARRATTATMSCRFRRWCRSVAAAAADLPIAHATRKKGRRLKIKKSSRSR